MRAPQDYKPIAFHQLCAIAKAVLQREPTIDDAEWKARTLETVAKYEFRTPEAHTLTHAMTQVEQAMKKTLGPRPVRMPPIPERSAQKPQVEPEPVGRTNSPPGWDIVVSLMAKLQAVRGSGPSLPPRPLVPRDTLSMSEAEILNVFWRSANEPGANKLQLLRAFTEIAIVRPADWNISEIRAEAHKHMLSASECFVCRGEYSDWHHVIQIQFGGSNYVRNRVPLCGKCHSDVHPWLPRVERRSGFVHLSGCTPREFAKLHKVIAS